MSEIFYQKISPGHVARRRFKVFGLTILSTFLAALKWVEVIPTDSTLLTRFLMVLLFVLTFGWIALFFWSSLFGFFELLRGRKVPGIRWVSRNTPIKGRTALLMPVYNEKPQAVFANLAAMAEELAATGQGRAFDVFVLSDTTNPQRWVEEDRKSVV